MEICMQISVTNQLQKQDKFAICIFTSLLFFYRRSVSQHLKWTCKSGFLNCKFSTNARFYCKKCRFAKCIEVGMKPEQVNKTKKAIAAYFAEQEKNSRKTEELATSKNTLNDNIIVEKVFEVDLIPDGQDNTQPLFFDPKRSKTFGSDEASMFQQDPKMFQITRSDQLNPEDIHFFTGLVTSWRKILLKTCLDGMSSHSIHEEVEKYHKQSCDSSTLTYDTALDNTMIDLALDNIACFTDISGLNLSMQEKLRTLYQCFEIFSSSAFEGVTMRQSFATYGYNVESHPFSAIIPVYMQDMKIVDYLKSGMFKSPWAESLEVEEFFVKTCQTLKTFLSDPVLHLCFFNLLLCNFADQFGSSRNFCTGIIITEERYVLDISTL